MLLFLLAVVTVSAQQETMKQVVDRALGVAHQQGIGMCKDLLSKPDKNEVVPKNFDGKRIHYAGYKSWICGFYPGVMWLLYEDTPTEELKLYADNLTWRIEEVKNIKTNHDVGFMLNCSFGNGYRLTKDKRYLEVIKQGAQNLSNRFHPVVGCTRSWDNKKWQFPVIIDNMLNLEFLTYVGKLTGNDEMVRRAESHATVTMNNHFRPDFSCYHVVSYDTITGKPVKKQTHQGYADESAWARGQAWAVYGFTMMYRETGNKLFLEHAKKVANFLITHPRMPEDGIPYWDFDDPQIPNTYRDASAGAVIASALIELSTLDKDKKSSKRWREFGEKMIRSLASPAYMAEPGTNGFFLLKHSVGNYKKHSEMDVPLTYADYYYIEALLRLKKLLK